MLGLLAETGVEVIAGGVDGQPQRAMLLQLGCDLFVEDDAAAVSPPPPSPSRASAAR